MKELNVVIAGIGNIGSSLIESLINNKNLIFQKSSIKINILGISSKNKNKKRKINIDNFEWYSNAEDLLKIKNVHVLIELIGEEKGISFTIVKKALENKIHVVTANKALLSINGKELFKIAEDNNVLLLFEAAVAGGIPIINLLKQSLFLNKIKKISGILNGTTNFILSEMENKNSSFKNILRDAQQNGFAEPDPTNDVEGIDSAHKLSLLSTICFKSVINFNEIIYKGITDIHIEDIKNANKLGYKIKLLSISEIINNKLYSTVEPTLIKKESKLANVDDVLNGIIIETDHLKSLFLEGEGAGGVATTSSIISDLFEITHDNKLFSLGHSVKNLITYDSFNHNDLSSSYYLRMNVKDIPGVLAKITSNLNEEGISIETILQIPENIIDKRIDEVPIIITTHKTTANLLRKSILKIENLDFVNSKIIVIKIDKNIN